MLTLRTSPIAFAFAVALLVVAPVASAFVCGSPLEDCCSSARIDHARLSNQSAPIATVAISPAPTGIAPAHPRIVTIADSADTPALAPSTPLRI